MQGKTYAQVSELTREELIELYDQESKDVRPGLEFIKQEIWRLDSEKFNQRMEKMTSHMRWLTVFIAVLTVVNVGVFVYDVIFR